MTRMQWKDVYIYTDSRQIPKITAKKLVFAISGFIEAGNSLPTVSVIFDILGICKNEAVILKTDYSFEKELNRI